MMKRKQLTINILKFNGDFELGLISFALIKHIRYNHHGLTTRLYLPAQPPGAD